MSEGSEININGLTLSPNSKKVQTIYYAYKKPDIPWRTCKFLLKTLWRFCGDFVILWRFCDFVEMLKFCGDFVKSMTSQKVL